MLVFAPIRGGPPSGAMPLARHLTSHGMKLHAQALERTGNRKPAIQEAKLRPDMAPALAEALGVQPESPLTIRQVAALLAGRSADVKLIAGRRGDLAEGKAQPPRLRKRSAEAGHTA